MTPAGGFLYLNSGSNGNNVSVPFFTLCVSVSSGVSVPYVIGIVLSVTVALFASWIGFDRDRASYPTVSRG